MSDRTAIVSTSMGPVVALVSEPPGEPKGGLILLQGNGPSGRSGINGIWARIARELAGMGLVVLRFDFASEGDSTLIGKDVTRCPGWRRDVDLTVVRDIAPWFRERLGRDELFIAGSCEGGRVALELAADDPSVSGTFLVAPYLWHLPPHLRRLSPSELQAGPDGELKAGGAGWQQRRDPPPAGTLNDDDDLVAGLRSIVARGPAWMLIGEKERQEAPVLDRPIGVGSSELEVEVAPGIAIHPVAHPGIQELVERRLTERIAAALAERERSPAAL